MQIAYSPAHRPNLFKRLNNLAYPNRKRHICWTNIATTHMKFKDSPAYCISGQASVSSHTNVRLTQIASIVYRQLNMCFRESSKTAMPILWTLGIWSIRAWTCKIQRITLENSDRKTYNYEDLISLGKVLPADNPQTKNISIFSAKTYLCIWDTGQDPNTPPIGKSMKGSQEQLHSFLVALQSRCSKRHQNHVDWLLHFWCLRVQLSLVVCGT